MPRNEPMDFKAQHGSSGHSGLHQLAVTRPGGKPIQCTVVGSPFRRRPKSRLEHGRARLLATSSWDQPVDPARQRWLAGSDPDGVLDPGRILDLDASLLRDERRSGQTIVQETESTAIRI